MQCETVVALVIAIPVILFPAAFVWYLNIGGICEAIKEARARRAESKKDALEYMKTLDAGRKEALGRVKALERR